MLELLLLVIIANSAPVLARHLCGERAAWPIDGGRVLADGQPLLGTSKTWRGLASAVLACALVAPLLGIGMALGAAAGALTMAGDLAASFAKRRRGYPASGHAPVLDTVPEALLPAAALAEPFVLAWWEVPLLVALFHLTVRCASPLLYRLHLRRHPW
ncbi:MAG: CDP-archaeol synthase [Gammaproteobacteria bacterium]|nr:CDP-archaeol synthase [Gammaproteobacteria bacterium]